MTVRTATVVAPLLALALLGCGDGTPTQQQDGGASVRVAVAYGEVSREVALGDLTPAELGVRVADVVQAAWPELERAALAADFIASDGFRPSKQSPCKDLVPVPGDLLTRGYLDPATADLTWDEALGLGAAWWQHGTAVIHLIVRENPVGSVRVVHGADEAQVDLGTLPLVTVGAEQLAGLQSVVQAAAVVADPAAFTYDFECSDGYTVVAGHSDRVTPGWAPLGLGWIDPVSRNLTWDASLGYGTPWNAKDVVVVHVLD